MPTSKNLNSFLSLFQISSQLLSVFTLQSSNCTDSFPDHCNRSNNVFKQFWIFATLAKGKAYSIICQRFQFIFSLISFKISFLDIYFSDIINCLIYYKEVKLVPMFIKGFMNYTYMTLIHYIISSHAMKFRISVFQMLLYEVQGWCNQKIIVFFWPLHSHIVVEKRQYFKCTEA